MKQLSLIILFLFVGPFFLKAENNHSNNIFFQPVYIKGCNVPNYTYFPESGPVKGFEFNVGILKLDTSQSVTHFYNYPQFGLGVSYLDLGNHEVFGYEYSVFPFFSFSPIKPYQSLKIKMGIGLSYFTKMYNDSLNRQNKAIGSHCTWYFQLGFLQAFTISKHIKLSFGGAYLHGSNGHIQLPNFGLNMASANISFQYYLNNLYKPDIGLLKPKNNSERELFINIRQGNGVHVLGGTTGPLYGKKGMVYSGTVSGGIIFNKHFKVRTGFTYRYYQLQKEYAESHDTIGISISPLSFASNIYFLAGCEFLTGHCGIDIEGGINFIKPFYPYFFDEFEHGGQISYQLKRIFPARMGLNFYLLNTEKNPVNNISIGAHINANFGEADFSEISVNYTRIIQRN